MPSSHLSFCRPLLLLPSIFSSIRVFSNEYQQMLHTNLVYLATIADSNQNMQSLLPAVMILRFV
ncbi:hypothetical protein FD755_009342 [Muntiacus reevesi]|uniref:SS18 N-terminal domain-containing protein n=1 Tax=Muntiacus reevesi TaxID=9886 RepID=A0A5N3XV71_MUNRE|nr:hypothetical protein FD755_009342 [Muntiacus reevesi]